MVKPNVRFLFLRMILSLSFFALPTSAKAPAHQPYDLEAVHAKSRDYLFDNMKKVIKDGLPHKDSNLEAFDKFPVLQNLYDKYTSPKGEKFISGIQVAKIGETKIQISVKGARAMIDRVDLNNATMEINGLKINALELKTMEDLEKALVEPKSALLMNLLIAPAHALVAEALLGFAGFTLAAAMIPPVGRMACKTPLLGGFYRMVGACKSKSARKRCRAMSE